MRWFVGAYGILVMTCSVVWGLHAHDFEGFAIGFLIMSLPGLGITVAWIITLVECPKSVYALVRTVLMVISILSSGVYLLFLWAGLTTSPDDVNWGTALFFVFVHGPQYFFAIFCLFAALGSTWVGEKEPPAK